MESCWNCDDEVEAGVEYCLSCDRPVRIGPYKIIAQLRESQSSTVYLCNEDGSANEYAVKMVGGSPLAVAQARREIELLETIHHPNIIKMYDNRINPGGGYIVLEHVQGRLLVECLQAYSQEARDNFITWMTQLVEGVRAMHKHQICHGDLRPDNILIGNDGVVRIVDFSVSQVLSDGLQGNIQVGELEYWSPEMASSESYDLRTDLFSLGVIFYEIWTTERPIKADSPLRYRLHIANLGPKEGHGEKGKAKIPSVQEVGRNVPQHVNDLVDRMLAIDRNDRVSSAESVLSALRGPSVLNLTDPSVDNFQQMFSYIYGPRNQRSDPITILSHFLTNVDRVLRALEDDDMTRQRISEERLPLTFGWLCALATSIDWRISELVAIKYKEDACPYCWHQPCDCTANQHDRSEFLNRVLLQKPATTSLLKEKAQPIGHYQSRFWNIYGQKNVDRGIANLALHMYSEIAEAFDSFHRVDALKQKHKLASLHYELSDLVAWYFALLNAYSRNFDLENALISQFPGKCYRCLLPVCQCRSADAELAI